MKRHAWLWYLVAGLVTVGGHFLVHGTVQARVYELLGLSSALAVGTGLRLHRPPRPIGWVLMLCGQGLLSAGDLTSDLYQYVLHRALPTPSLADAFYLVAYPLLLAGLFLVVRPRERRSAPEGLIDAAIVATGAGVVIWIFVVHRYEQAAAHSMAALVAMVYPLMDVLLVGMLARVLFAAGRRTVSYYLLVLGVLGLLAADIGHAVLIGQASQAGSPWAVGWLLSYLLIGAAGLHPSMAHGSQAAGEAGLPAEAASRRLSISRLRLLAAVALVPFAVFAGVRAFGGQVDETEIMVGTSILFVLVLTRMSSLLREIELKTVEIKRQRARFQSLVQNSSDVITVVDPRGIVHYQSPAIGPVFGHDPAAVIGTEVADLLHPDDRSSAFASFARVLADPSQMASFASRFRHADGSWRNCETAVTNLVPDPSVGGLVLNTRDVTERIGLEQQLKHLAFHDPLTDLGNRMLFTDHVQRALSRGRRTGTPLAVLFLDVDEFKAVNDGLGHPAGDQLLVTIAERLRGCVRAGDTVARFGGDEFAILLEDLAEPSLVIEVADRIMQVLRQPVLINGREVLANVSMGVTVSQDAQEDADVLLRDADAAMYLAKSNGKSRYEVFERSLHVAALERVEMEADLRRAVQRQEFVLHYQPVVELATGRVAGVEALIRWMHPRKGMVPPLEFVPIAELTGLIVPIGRWAMEEACRQMARWHHDHPSEPGRSLSVNLSARQLQEPGVVGDIASILAATDLDPRQLVLEITESVFLRDTEGTLRLLQELRALGVGLGLDDFGTGYSSLSYLHRFPIDVLKIDKSFIDGVVESPERAALVAGIVRLGQSLDLRLVAEGIETPEQRDRLRDMGCPLGQGFYFAKPLEGPSIEHILAGDAMDAPAHFAERAASAAHAG
jgi:diguanylate cyclase (GGDEF)-like protein/PAS domain S-box-containing protein